MSQYDKWKTHGQFSSSYFIIAGRKIKMTAFQNKISEKVLWFSFWRTGWDRLAHLIEGQQSEQGTWWSLSVLDATVWEQPRQLSLSSRGTRGTLVHVWAGKRILNSSGLSGVEEGWVKDWTLPTWKRQGLAGEWLSSKAERRPSENTCKFASKNERVGLLEQLVIGLIQRKMPYPSPIRSIPKGPITTQSHPSEGQVFK